MRILLLLLMIIPSSSFAGGCYDEDSHFKASSFQSEDWLKTEVNVVENTYVLPFWLPRIKNNLKLNAVALIFADDNFKNVDLMVEIKVHDLKSESVGKVVLRKDLLEQAWLSIQYNDCDSSYNFRLKELVN